MKTCIEPGCTSPRGHGTACHYHARVRKVKYQLDRGDVCDYCGEEPRSTRVFTKGLCPSCYLEESRHTPIAGSQVERYLKAPGGLTAAAFLAKIFPNGDAARALKEAHHA